MPNPQPRPAPATTTPRSVEGRSAVVGHDRHIVPDTLAGQSHMNSGMMSNRTDTSHYQIGKL